jgi:hypothetical protein
LTIVWDQLIVENTLLAGIIVGSIYLELWGLKRSQRKEEKENTKRIIMFIVDDLQKRLDFIEETYTYKDFKPLFTDMWDAIVLAGKHALLPFELFQSLQRTYSWMKYYNSELDGGKPVDEKILVELLDDVRKSIYSSLNKLNDNNNKTNKDTLEDVQRSNITNKTKIGGNLSTVATRIIEK